MIQLHTNLLAREQEADQKEQEYQNEKEKYKQMEVERTAKEEQFVNDKYNYNKEISKLKDDNRELEIKKQAQEN